MSWNRKVRCIGVAVMLVAIATLPSGVAAANSDEFDAVARRARMALKKGIAFYHSIAIEGGYVYSYTLDLKEKWGEGRTDDRTIEVQPPGTPAVGMSFLRAYRVLGDADSLQAARDAGHALIRGQNELGGWGHTIRFGRPKGKSVSFDDDQTQSAIRFLMALDQVTDSDELSAAIDKALNMMLAAQMECGGWPHQYPKQWNYHDFATFNDNGINDCLAVMLDARRYYGKPEYQQSIDKAGWFLMLSQLPPPQPGWAQQYNAYLQPAWARAFEPPAVCPQVTVRNVHLLLDLYLETGSRRYLEPIPDALRWLDSCRLANGKWARFIELGTGKPLYYDRGRIRVDSMAELSLERRTGYGYESDISAAIERARQRFDALTQLGRQRYLRSRKPSSRAADVEKRLARMRPGVLAVVQSQDPLGRWIVKNDRYRRSVSGHVWNGEYATKDRISSALFNRNVARLCDYLELDQALSSSKSVGSHSE